MSLHLFSNYIFAVLSFFSTVFVLPKHLTTKLTWDHMNSRTQYFPTQVNKHFELFVCLFVYLFVLISWSDKLAEYDRGLLLTVTEVSTTCVVVIFKVKVSCITSVDGVSDHIHSDDNTRPTYEMTPGFKLFTVWSGKVNFPPWKDWKAYV